MSLEPEQCYQAILSGDQRFDGRFFTGIVTTGIYCRPICPVRPARPENMRFFGTAAAAEESGFRPCRRCRPETSAGTPTWWLGGSALVSRALQLINEGAFDSAGVEGLARRLGISPRQLRRLFVEHLGASPAAVARARRVHFVRRLIDETDLSMAEIAFSAGFSSIRSFNHAVRKTFGRTPSELRARDRRRGSVADGLTVRLAYRPPLDWDAIVDFLAPRAIPGVEAISDGYERTVEIDGEPGCISVRPEPEAARLRLQMQLPSHRELIQVVERAKRIFDLGADPLAIAAGLREGPLVESLVAARPGLRVPRAWDGFELTVRAVLGQQVSVRAATTLIGRLVAKLGTPVVGQEARGLTHLFPSPLTLADADLTGLGVTSRRAATIRAVASAVASGELRFDTAPGLEEIVDRLMAVPGIGSWTAHYVAMRAFGEPDAFPASDLGLRRAASHTRRPLPERELARVAEHWRPWRAYAAMHLWQGVSIAQPASR